MDWRLAGDYAFTADLDPAGWAWQFLRRCPGYREDYRWFSQTWQALESEYGAPPERDFFRWKQDPRAWRAEGEIAGCGTDICPGVDDKVLIECWMGAKWGFRKFPQDPADSFPAELAWRTPNITLEPLTSDGLAALSPEQVALAFDLDLPLGPQLDATRLRLAQLRHGLARTGQAPLSPSQAAPRWTSWLRLLDSLEAGTEPGEAAHVLDLADPAAEAEAARRMRCHEYRRILRFID
jgi:hypothetical protein